MSILTFDHPALHTVSTPIDPLNADDRIQTVLWAEHAKQSLIDDKTGVGLAANQTGLTRRIILMWPGRRQGQLEPMLMINPVVEATTRDTEVGNEGCLSYPGVFVDLRRAKYVEVKYLDANFQPAKARFSGFAARVAQHEVDHLNGVCLVGDAWRKRKAKMDKLMGELRAGH